MDIYDEELLNLWRSFKEFKVKYIMIGGIATNLHGYSRTTSDIDIWIKDSLSNRNHLLLALKSIGLDYLEDLQNFEFLPGWTSFRTTSGMELDIMTYLKGFPQIEFENSFNIASIALIFELEIPFLNINQLIEAKKATSRSKDLIDIEELKKIKELRDKSL